MFSRLFTPATPTTTIRKPSSSQEHPNEFRAARIPQQGGEIELQTVPWRDPAEGEVVVKVIACGISKCDIVTKDQSLGEIQYPRTVGHELIGDIIMVGPNEQKWKEGDRVGGSWHGGHCGVCVWCRKGEFAACENQEINGYHRDGGLAEYMIMRSNAVIAVPADVDPVEETARIDSGATVFNALKNLDLQPGETVLIDGVGGLASSCSRLARVMGYKSICLAPNSTSAHHLMMNQHQPHDILIKAQIGIVGVVEEMTRRGGARAVLCTSSDVPDAEHLMKCLCPGGQMVLVAPHSTESLSIPLKYLVLNRLSVVSFPCCSPAEVEEELRFALNQGLKLEEGVKRFSMDQVKEAWEEGMKEEGKEKVVVVM